MITFETQQDFEDAVMRVIRERLEVRVSARPSMMGDQKFTKVKLLADGVEFSNDEDYA